MFRGGGQDVLAAGREQRMEGVVAKRLTSTYRPGQRSPDWRKVKFFRTQEVVIAGWRPGKGRRAGGIGALILAVPGPDGLAYVGGVGTGFTERALRELEADLAPHARHDSPFARPLTAAERRDAHWVDPVLVGEVTYAEWTGDGHLRHPAWRGLRPDKLPPDVVRED
jgi:bifunctional non-homologous end joining protein LigD